MVALRTEFELNLQQRRGMSKLLESKVLAAAALVLSAGWTTAWLAGLLVDGDSWPIRLALLAVGVLLAGGSVFLLRYRAKQDRRAVRRHFEALCRLDPQDLRSDTVLADALPSERNNPWHNLADSVREALIERCEQLQELEHARAAADIRCRRASTQYERIKAILSGLTDPVIVVDDYDQLVLANPTAEALFRFDADNLETRVLSQLLDCQKLTDLLKTTSHRKSGGSRTEEIELADKQGLPRSYRVTASKLSTSEAASADKEPAPGGAVAVLRDIGDQKALQKRNAEFVSSVSHEMKTPLAGIKAYVELLVDGDVEDRETQEEFLNVIDSQADRLQRLVDNMLNLARIEAGVVSVDKQNRSLNELLEESLHVVQPAAEAKRIQLASDLSPMYLGVLADRDMMLQTAINLLSNAIKYTPEGGRVTLRSRLQDDEVRFEVEDTGVGLSEEDCQRVFEKFYRVKANREMATGTGLGLPLAKYIVEDVHSGNLSVQSTEGQGSTFAVTLPNSGQLT